MIAPKLCGRTTPAQQACSYYKLVAALGGYPVPMDSLGGHEHLVHPSNLRRDNGFVMEAVLVYHISNAVYRPL